jgi:hypothetical protein
MFPSKQVLNPVSTDSIRLGFFICRPYGVIN